MTFSSLISGTIPHHNKYNMRPGGIASVDKVIQHHWASPVDNSGDISLGSPGRKASATYLIHSDGKIFGQVPEEFRPWTSGGAAADNTAITIECQNSTGAPTWEISAAAEDAIVRLLADIATRHAKFNRHLTRSNYRGHREFASTACPGPYLYPRLQLICDKANTVLGGGTVPVDNPLPPAQSTNADGSTTLAIDGSRGPKTIARWQEVMGTKIDTVISKPVSELIKADQRFLNSVVLPEHIKNLTGKSALDVDGDEGKKTIIVRQFWLRNAMNPIHQQNLIGHLLDFDGILGPDTNKVHQFALNNTTSGSKRYGEV